MILNDLGKHLTRLTGKLRQQFPVFLLYLLKKIDMSQKMPRRIKEDSQLPAEIAIGTAMVEIEKLGADVKLTDAVILLQKAKDLVSDFIDGSTNEA